MSDRFHHWFISQRDFARSLAFYRDVLGWTVVNDWEDRGAGRGAVLSGGGIRLVLSERDWGNTGAGDARPELHLDIHDIDGRFEAIPKGEHVVAPPQPTQWGTRWFVVRDPDGNVIAFEELHGSGA
jgi:catechol 2,3-dioxygenase-like lactoylglutathione lyase family enzyme